jgi:hypothetical protein
VTHPLYARLVDFARREYELVMQEDFEALAELADEREAIVAALPATAPESAKPFLLECAQIQARTTAALHEARARTARELGAADRERATVEGYSRASAGAPPRGTITVAA